MAATRSLNVLIVHGIGTRPRLRTYARPLEIGIRRAFDRVINRLPLPDVAPEAARSGQALRFETVCWDPVTQTPQDALLLVLFGKPWLLQQLSLTGRLRRQIVGLVGDVIAYEAEPNNPVYRAIHAEVARGLDALGAASAGDDGADGGAPLTIIGHSLGSVIASDYVWDQTHGQTHCLDAHGLALVNMVLLGSPMALYALRRNAGGGPESIRESLSAPALIDPDGGWWLNLFDRQDALACPLEPVDAYRRAGVIDCPVRAGSWLTGWNLGSHTGYWACRGVATIIGSKLAIDWARANSPRFAERYGARALDALRAQLKRR
ncbi:MAG: hypothetical protein LC121_19100 [Anaerolineae bacterium]|nr:hypothetical protein [Anaerolineae bacterium]